MSQIPTAKELLKNQMYPIENSSQENVTSKAMIEFAKLHVKAALKEASEKVKMKLRDDVYDLDMNDDWMEVDKNSILNAYSLENIK